MCRARPGTSLYHQHGSTIEGRRYVSFRRRSVGKFGDSGEPTCNMCESYRFMAEIVLGRAKTIPDKGLLLQQSTSNVYPRFALKAFCHGNALASEG